MLIFDEDEIKFTGEKRYISSMPSEKITPINLGNPTTFQRKYKEYFLPLKFFALKYIDDPELACDFIQDLFTTLWSKREQFQNEIAVKVYLYRSIRNMCLNHIRNSKKQIALEQDLNTLQTEDTFIHNIIEAEIYTSIKKAFSELPEKTRKIYQLSLDGKSHAEIAELLQISINTVKKQKNMAHHLLRSNLKHLFSLIILLHG